MIKKITSLLLIIMVVVIFITGCDGNKKDDSKTNDDKTVSSIDDLKSGEGTLHCTRTAVIEGGNGTFNYYVSYRGDDLTHLVSTESVKSDDSSVLDTYEDSYKKIDSYYEDIKYYDTKIERTNDTVTYNIEIDYEKIDIQKLIDLEGEDDNIFENNKAKLSKYFDFTKKLGVTCSESTV